MALWHLPSQGSVGPIWLIRRRPPARFGGRLFLLVLTAAVALMSLDFSWKYAQAQSPYAVSLPPTANPSASSVPTVATRSMEEPLRLIQQARQSFARIRDYECTLVKQERIDGVMTPETVIQMKARTQPNSVALVWRQPACQCGQEAYYVEGRNQGNLRARGAGVLGLVGFVSLDPQSPRARGASRYTINEAGLGYLIERYARGWQVENQLNLTEVRIDLAEFNGRPGIRVETVHPTRREGLLYYRSVVWFDQVSNLPLRVENYDWPVPGSQVPELVEQFSFLDLRLNVGLTDEAFNK